MIDNQDLFDWLIENGLKYGYYPEPSKNYLVVHSSFLDKAHYLFDEFVIKVREERQYLGGYVGSEEWK